MSERNVDLRPPTGVFFSKYSLKHLITRATPAVRLLNRHARLPNDRHAWPFDSLPVGINARGFLNESGCDRFPARMIGRIAARGFPDPM